MAFQFFVCLGGFNISCSKFHSDFLFTFFRVYKSYHSGFQSHMYFRVRIQTHSYVIQCFLSCHQYSYCQIWYRSFSSKSDSIFSWASYSSLTLLFFCRSIPSTACLKIAFLSWCLLNYFLFAVLCPWSLVGLLLEYLEPKSPKTLHSSYEFLGPFMRHVGLDLSFGLSTYLFLCLLSLSLIS